jgi:Camelysin metallo-endopeptidase
VLTTRKILASLVVVGIAASVAAFGVFSAFSSSTSNPGNSFTAGTVNISDNDANAAAYNVSNGKPGSTQSECIRVVYTGSLDSDVHLYTPESIGTLGPYVNLTVTPGTQATPNPNCSGFTPDSGGAIYNGTLSAWQTAHHDWATGLSVLPSASATKWVTNDAVVYQVQATLADDNNANGVSSSLSTGTHSFVWEARNQ